MWHPGYRGDNAGAAPGRRPQPLAAHHIWRNAMSRLSIVGATAVLLALAVGTPTFAVELRGVDGHRGGAMHFGSGGLGGGPAKHRLRGNEKPSPRYRGGRGAYYTPGSGKYMGDDGEWHASR